MDTGQLIPTPDLIPVAWGWLEFLLLLTFVLHLLFMNAMLGSALLGFIGSLGRPGRGERNGTLAGRLPFLIAFTVNTGVAPLLFLQVLYGHLAYTSSILMAPWWLAIIGILLVLYYAVYLCCLRFPHPGLVRTVLLGLACLGLLIIGFLFTNNMSLMIAPDRWIAWLHDPSSPLFNLGDPTLAPRYLHFLVASLAVGGLVLVLFNSRRARDGEETAAGRVRRGFKIFAWATVVQIGVGLWWLMALPREVMLLFMGGNPLATILLLVGLAAVALTLTMAFQHRLRSTLTGLVATICLMAGMRDLVRQAYLEPWFHPADLRVDPQYGPMLLFAVTLVVGLAVLAYMLRLGARAGREA